MRIKIKGTLLIFLLVVVAVKAQDRNILTSLNIPENLRKNANAVLRLEHNDIVLKSYKEMNINYRRVITVLNEKGVRNVSAFLHYDHNVKVKRLEAIVYDKFGTQIKKIKKKDFHDVSAVDGGTLYSDSRMYYLNYTPISYPYTVDFTYEYESQNTAFLRRWFPLKGHYISTQKSVFNFSWEGDLGIRTKEENFEGYEIDNNSSAKQLSYSIENIEAIRRESYGPVMESYAPALLVAANKFHLEGVDGFATNWKEFGAWYSKSILFDTNDLPAVTKDKMKALVAGVEAPLEKAKIVHRYMQNKTRYISVQIGIGGWKPMQASEVDKLGYGDCKALTNYTKSLLEAVGVTSYFTIIYGSRSSKKSIDENFTRMQGNHAILAVEDGKDLVWIDCTSQRDPFGFVAGFTDDRMALVVKPTGGEMIRTTRYAEEDNYQKTIADYKITEAGDISGIVTIKTKGTQYRRSSTLETDSKKEIEDHYKERFWDYINNLSLEQIEFSNNKDNIEFTEELRIKAVGYTTMTNDKMLVAPNAFNKITSIPDRYRNRKKTLEIERGYVDEDEYRMTLPEGYVIEFIPENVTVETKFGNYSFTLEVTNDVVVYKRRMLLKEGKHTKEEYANYRSFIRKIVKLDNSKIVLTKK